MKLSLTPVVTTVAFASFFALGACAGGQERTTFEDPSTSPVNGDQPTGDLGKPGDKVDPASTPCGAAAQAKGYAGCDFRVAPSPVKGMISDAAPCYAVFLTNVAKTPAKITVSLDGKSFDATKFGRKVPTGAVDPISWPALDASGLEPGAMAVLFLSHQPGAQSTMFDPVTCPVTPAVEDASGQPKLVPGRAQTFRITTDQPVVAYDMMPFGGARSYAPSAQIVLPASAWGTNYVAAMPPSDPVKPDEASGQNQWIMISAGEDGTTVDISTKGIGLTGSGSDSVPANSKATISLAAGDYALWMAPRNGTTDATGTVVKSNKPVAVMTGDIWTGIASSSSEKKQMMGNGQPIGAPVFCCMDASHQMLAPISGLGSEYIAAPFPTRLGSMEEETIKYRIVGLVEGTTLTFDPPIAGAPSSIAALAVAEFEAVGAFRVKSQDDKHPIYVSQSMTYASTKGSTRLDGTDGAFKVTPSLPLALGDPEAVSVQPAGQYLGEYTFLTDPTYATTSLVVTRVKGPSGFSDVTLECLGKIDGWKPIGSSGTYEFARVDLVRKNVPNGKCGVSAHKAKSDGKFGVVVWGVDWWASYAYPAGGSVAKLNDVIVEPR